MPEPLLLASASPRRLETLRHIGFDVVVRPADVDETVYDELPVPERVVALAELKAKAGAAAVDGGPRWAVGADTLVAVDGATLGKPVDADEARSMIAALAGRTHIVASGVCVVDRRSGRSVSSLSETSVRFVSMERREIDAYIESGEWVGVAGAYRIQEKAAFFIDRIDGSFSGVVGLPIREFYDILVQIGYPFRMESYVDTAVGGV